MAHTCSYFCQDPVHALRVLIDAKTPYECEPPDVQARIREELLLDIRCVEPLPVVNIEEVIPARDCSSVDFYRHHEGWTVRNLPDSRVATLLPYVLLVRYAVSPVEVPDAVSGS